MTQVCLNCHSSTLVEGHFASATRPSNSTTRNTSSRPMPCVQIWPTKGLLKDNPWKDEFEVTYYYLWHHEGRRARQGAIMMGADWSHWHGFFELMQDIYKLEDIYALRIETGEIE